MIPMRIIQNYFRDPRDTKLQRWWLRYGLLCAWLMMLVAVFLMTWSSFDIDHPHRGDDARGWAVLAGIASAMMFTDCLGQRVIVRLTQIFALFTTDVAPRQPGLSAGGEQGRPASITEIYRGPGGPPVADEPDEPDDDEDEAGKAGN